MAGQPAADGVDLAREEAEAASLLLATQLQAEAEREVDWRAEYAAAQETSNREAFRDWQEGGGKRRKETRKVKEAVMARRKAGRSPCSSTVVANLLLALLLIGIAAFF